MIRVGRFELDARDARARRHLASVAWVPRGRKEAAVTRVLTAAPALATAGLVRHLGRAAPDAPDAPSHESALQAVRAVLGAGTEVTAPVAMLPAPGSAAPRRLLLLWRGDDAQTFAIAKVAAAARAEALHAEARALTRLAGLAVPELIDRVPRVLALAEHAGLAVLVMTVLPGVPLLRRHRLGRALAWDATELVAVGAALGALHAATASAAGSLVHGDAWSRNVLVEGAALTGLLDWEACREGDPAQEAAHFLAASACADVAGRGVPPSPRLATWPPAALAFAEAWAARLGAPSTALDSCLAAELAAHGSRDRPCPMSASEMPR